MPDFKQIADAALNAVEKNDAGPKAAERTTADLATETLELVRSIDRRLSDLGSLSMPAVPAVVPSSSRSFRIVPTTGEITMSGTPATLIFDPAKSNADFAEAVAKLNAVAENIKKSLPKSDKSASPSQPKKKADD
jgi:hypothetical protein